MAVDYEVIICTKDRPEDLARTVRSVFAVGRRLKRLIAVDASQAEVQEVNARTLGRPEFEGKVEHLWYAGRPSLARQRNEGIGALYRSTDIVHFLDDDVELEAGYFEAINSVLENDSQVVGAGGYVFESVPYPADRSLFRRAASRLFMLSGPRLGRILLSGWTTPAQTRPLNKPIRVQWLGGCAAYRRTTFDSIQFDSRLEGYSLDEDLDLSHRMAKIGSLYVTPEARLVHYRSPVNRELLKTTTRDSVVHRYWFVRKNMSGVSKMAFWWSLLGKWLALKSSNSFEAQEALEGLKEAVRVIRERKHYLLEPAGDS